jgi:hypothetical protein
MNKDNKTTKPRLSPDEIKVVIDRYIKSGNYKAAGDIVDVVIKGDFGVDWEAPSSVRLVDYVVHAADCMAAYVLASGAMRGDKIKILDSHGKCVGDPGEFKNVFYIFADFMTKYGNG